MGPSSSITALLQESRKGGREATDLLLPVVYDQLRKLAESYLAQERPGHTLAPTALVHEAYLRLAASDMEWQDRVHFFAVAARQMRRILVDHARARQRGKRGSAPERVTLSEDALATPEPTADVLDIDRALTRLAEFDARKSEILELVYFGGLTADEAAEATGVSSATINRELKMAKAWLYAQLR